MPRRKAYESRLPPKRNHRISVKEAAALTRRYRDASPASEKTGFFHAGALRDLLSQPGCVGFRYYHGLDDRGCYRIVLVGVDANGADMVRPPKPQSVGALPKSGAGNAKASGPSGEAVLLENHYPCPPWCPPPSPLNS